MLTRFGTNCFKRNVKRQFFRKKRPQEAYQQLQAYASRFDKKTLQFFQD